MGHTWDIGSHAYVARLARSAATAASLTQLCKFDCAKEVLESAILWTKCLTAPPPSRLYRVPYVWGGPRLYGGSFGTMLEFGTK